MNLATRQLLDHVAARPVPPMSTSAKETFAKFARKYSKWLVMLDLITADVKKQDKPISELTREEAEEMVQDAEGVLRAEYYSDVRSIAQEIAGELTEKLKAGERGEKLREWLLERSDSAVDSHYRIVYTWQSQKVLLFSDSSGAYIENFGDEGIAEGGDIAWSKLAWAAMREDVREQLEAEGIDINEPDNEDTIEALGLAAEDENDE